MVESEAASLAATGTIDKNKLSADYGSGELGGESRLLAGALGWITSGVAKLV